MPRKKEESSGDEEKHLIWETFRIHTGVGMVRKLSNFAELWELDHFEYYFAKTFMK